MFKVFWISNTGDFSVCGNNVDANVSFAPVLDLLHAHGDSTKSLRLSRLVPFAIRTYFVSSVRKSASYLGEGIQFIQKPPCKRCLKFSGYLIQATFQSVERMLMQTLCLSPHPSFGHPLQIGRGKYNLYKSQQLKVFESFLIIFKKATSQSVEKILMQTFRLPLFDFFQR